MRYSLRTLFGIITVTSVAICLLFSVVDNFFTVVAVGSTTVEVELLEFEESASPARVRYSPHFRLSDAKADLQVICREKDQDILLEGKPITGPSPTLNLSIPFSRHRNFISGRVKSYSAARFVAIVVNDRQGPFWVNVVEVPLDSSRADLVSRFQYRCPVVPLSKCSKRNRENQPKAK